MRGPNRLKAALTEGRVQRGIWLALGSPAVAELAGHAGFDWCLIDAEHGPNTLSTIQAQAMALEAAGCEAVVRVPVGEDWVIKGVLDLGLRSVMVPMVHDGPAAARAVAAMRYPPAGRRGLGAMFARASRYGQDAGYAARANAQICCIVQAESAAAVENIDAIAGTDGVDCVFIGPADLSADMGYPGEMHHPEVARAIAHLTDRTRAAGKAVGVIWGTVEEQAAALAGGVSFLGVGADATALTAALTGLSGGVTNFRENS